MWLHWQPKGKSRELKQFYFYLVLVVANPKVLFLDLEVFKKFQGQMVRWKKGEI